jgi:hypothetical protein
MVLLEKLRRDDYIRDSGLIFQAQENKSLGGSWTLPNNHGTDNRNGLAIVQLL